MHPDLTPDVTGGIARFKPIRLNLLARDAICAAEARGANASNLDKAAESAAIYTDIRQIKVLLKQAGSAIDKAVSDAYMTQEQADTMDDLLAKSIGGLTPDNLASSVTILTSACGMFD